MFEVWWTFTEEMNMKTILTSFFLFFSISCLGSTLDEQIDKLQLDVPRISQIIQQVGIDVNQPTKRLHDEFWGLILTRIQGDPKKLSLILNDSVVNPIKYQKEFWKSIQITYKNKKVTTTSKLYEFHNDIPKMKMTSDYLQRETSMLEAASKHSPYKKRDGSEIKFDDQMIQNTINNIDGLEVRLQKLLNPDWK